jgi:hypothetical protein
MGMDFFSLFFFCCIWTISRPSHIQQVLALLFLEIVAVELETDSLPSCTTKVWNVQNCTSMPSCFSAEAQGNFLVSSTVAAFA